MMGEDRSTVVLHLRTLPTEIPVKEKEHLVVTRQVDLVDVERVARAPAWT
jgi:hypothetical protein